MLISDMIIQLGRLMDKHGDLPCYIEQVYKDEFERMEVANISAKMTQFVNVMTFKEFERREDAGMVNSIVITDLPD